MYRSCIGNLDTTKHGEKTMCSKELNDVEDLTLKIVEDATQIYIILNYRLTDLASIAKIFFFFGT